MGFRPVLGAAAAAVIGLTAAACGPPPDPVEPSGPTTHRVSVSSSGEEGNLDSTYGSVSNDGRYVAFSSRASNLVEDDTNIQEDVFVRDTKTGQTSRVSVSSAGDEGDARSVSPHISGNGRYVTFISLASNFVSDETDTDGTMDVFVHDRVTGETELITRNPDGTPTTAGAVSPHISDDGSRVAYVSAAGAWQAYVHDRDTGIDHLVSVSSSGTPGNADTGAIRISGDGNHVAFDSYASNLVPGDTNFEMDVFAHDLETQTTHRVSVRSDGTQVGTWPHTTGGPSLSDDGRFISFASSVPNLVDDDTNGSIDVFVHDRDTGQTTRVSTTPEGVEGDGHSSGAALSGNGRYVAYTSSATNLTPDGGSSSNVILRDLSTGTVESVASSAMSSAFSWVDVTPTARFVVFDAIEAGLVPDDENGFRDVFIRDTGD